MSAGGIRGRAGLVIAVAALAAAPLGGCGGTSSSHAEKQASISAALQRLQSRLGREEAERRARARAELEKSAVTHLGAGGEAIAQARREALRRAEIVLETPRPRGVTGAEWNAAITHDARLHRLVLGAAAGGGPTVIEVPTPAAVAKAGGHALAEYEAGKKAVAQSGCLACHRIGQTGNEGPGPNLTEVAGRLPKQAIARTLVAPTPPMPSFKNVPPEKFQAIVAFLAQLR
jgi:mono/diheme cytochrome c family protein